MIDKQRIIDRANYVLAQTTAGRREIGSERQDPVIHALLDALVVEFSHELDNIKTIIQLASAVGRLKT